MSMFLITDDSEARLKSYDATTRGRKTLLRVTVEVTDAYALAHMLQSLEQIAQAQARKERAKQTAAKPSKAPSFKSVEHQRLLTLPPPEPHS